MGLIMTRVTIAIASIWVLAGSLAEQPVLAQDAASDEVRSRQLMDCVNKATTENPGPDRSKRYDAIKRCHASITSEQIYNGDVVFEARRQRDVEVENKAKARQSQILSMMDRAEQLIKQDLKDPDSSIIDWNGGFTYFEFKPDLLTNKKSGFGGCGFVNAKNSFGGYVGKRRFVVIFDDVGGSVIFKRIYTGNSFDFTESSCAAISFPPLPQRVAQASSASSVPSVVAELEALARLRDTGTLTQAEFERAKARLLGKD